MRIVFLAAGKGTRIYRNIKTPKALIKIKRKCLIERLILNVEKKYRDKITIVTGFEAKKIFNETKKFKINYLHNIKYNKTEMLHSMYLALKKYDDDILFSYSDIFYEAKIIKKFFFKKQRNIIVPINLNWKNIWLARKKNIFEDAETLRTKKGNIVEIGNKIINLKEVEGQYMGIFFIPKKYRIKIINVIQKNNFKKKQITYFINYLIKKNFKIRTISYKGFWYEFDDSTDLNQFKKLYYDRIL